MSILDFILMRKPVEELQTTAEPISINSVVDTPISVKRNMSRLITLYEAVEQGDSREEILSEIELRKTACMKIGHDAPQTLIQAKQLLYKITKHEMVK